MAGRDDQMDRHVWQSTEKRDHRAGASGGATAAAHCAENRAGFFDQLRGMLAAAELVTIAEHVAACRDPDDDKFLELAVNGNADAIISGDADLLSLDTFRGIPIITAAAFARARVR